MRCARVLLALVGLAGCDDAYSELEGIYTIATWTENTQGCDAEGPSIAASREAMLYLKVETFFGPEFLNVVECPDQGACVAEANDGTPSIGAYAFDTGNDEAGWTSRIRAVLGDAGMCVGSVSDTTLTASGQTIRIEKRTIVVVPFEGPCSEARVDQAAAAQPCSHLEVATATYTADF